MYFETLDNWLPVCARCLPWSLDAVRRRRRGGGGGGGGLKSWAGGRRWWWRRRRRREKLHQSTRESVRRNPSGPRRARVGPAGAPLPASPRRRTQRRAPRCHGRGLHPGNHDREPVRGSFPVQAVCREMERQAMEEPREDFSGEPLSYHPPRSPPHHCRICPPSRHLKAMLVVIYAKSCGVTRAHFRAFYFFLLKNCVWKKLQFSNNGSRSCGRRRQ